MEIKNSIGLPKTLWSKVIHNLERIISFYDLGNRFLSLFQDWKIRNKAIDFLFSGNNMYSVLDLGGGPGNLEPLLHKKAKYIVYVDTSSLMTMYAKRVHKKLRKVNYVRAVFEYLPFRNGIIDVGIASYSFRDSFNLVKALQEAAKVLKKRLVIADIGKPDGRLQAKLVGLYFKIFVPLITALVTGWVKGNPWKLLYTTYVYLPSNSTYKMLLGKIFGKAFVVSFLMGAAVILIGEKRLHASLRTASFKRKNEISLVKS